MKRTLFAIICIVLSCASYRAGLVRGNRACRVEIIHDTVTVEQPSQWDSLIEAIGMVESNGRFDAYNEQSGAAGLLQIMPIYVAEANRILGKEVYSLEDRFDPIKSVEMFCVVQGRHNPEKDIDKAIRLHNPRGGESYARKVKRFM